MSGNGIQGYNGRIETRIGEIAELGSGSTPARAKHDRFFSNGTIWWVKTGDLNNGLIASTEERITENAISETACKIYPVDTVLVAMYGGFKQIGRTGVLGVPAAINQALTAISVNKAKVHPVFLQHWLNAQVDVWRNLAGSSRKDPNITKTEVAAFPVLLPPLTEQKAIAAVLSAWDRAIEQTTALIAAKQRLKQGLMQQLFGEAAHSQRQLESKLCHLGDVASETTRRNGGGLGTDAVYSVTKASGMIPMPLDTIGSDIARYKLVRPKAFAYNPMRINIGSIARWEGESEVLVSPDYVVFECGPELDPDYLNHFRRGHVWDSYVKRSGDGSVRVRIYFDHLSRMRIRLPDIKEQRRIAKLLNVANADLSHLERKLYAIKRQKRGLMQQLLTGNRRIPHAVLSEPRHD